MKVKKGEKVKVISGKHKGTVAEVLSVDRKKNRVVVETINVKKKTLKKTDSTSTENFVYIQHPIHISNVVKVGDADVKSEAKVKVKETKSSAKKTSTKKTGKTRSSK